MLTTRSRISAFYLLGLFVDLINTFVAGVASPTIGRALNAGVSAMAWISTGYVLGITLAIPASAWLAYRFGTRRLLLGALAAFALMTALTAAADHLATLLCLRILQGVCAGLFIPVGQSLVYSQYLPHERARVTTMIMAIGLLAPALSPMLGGFIVASQSWHWVFASTLPPALLALALGSCWLPANGQRSTAPAFDIGGLLLGLPALGLLLLALTDLGENHWLRGPAELLGAGIFMHLYGRHARRARHPLVDFSLLNDPLLRIGLLIYHAVPGLFIGVNILAMLYLQQNLGVSAQTAGALMIPWTAGAALAIFSAGRLFNRLGPGPLLIVGILLQAIGFVGLATVPPHALLQLSATYALMGLGASLCTATAQSGAFLNIAPARLPQASTLWTVNRQLSFCAGITLTSLAFNLLAHVLAPVDAYRGCFLLAAASAVLPLLWQSAQVSPPCRS